MFNFFTMLQQYGIATPSSVTPVSHPEDAQPNEVIKKRRGRGLPPRVASSASRSRGFHGYRGSGSRGSYPPRGSYRGSYRGATSHQGDQFTQYASREKTSWRGSSRGPKSNQNSPTTDNAHWWSRQSEDKLPSTHGRPDLPSSNSTSSLRLGPTSDPRSEAHFGKTNYSSTNLSTTFSQDNHANHASTATSSHWARGGRETDYQQNNYNEHPPAMNWSHYDNTGSSRVYPSSGSTPPESIDRHNPSTLYQSLPSTATQMRSMHPPQGVPNYGHNQNPNAMDWSGLSSANISSSNEPIRSGLLNPATILQPLQLMLPQLQFTLPSPSIVNWMAGLNELIPNLNQKPAPIPLSQQSTTQQSSSVPVTMHTDVDKLSSLSNDAESEPIQLSGEISTSSAGNAQSSTAKPRPVLPTRKWMYRSKSPSPKLPDAPLKRRKLESDHDFSPTNSGSETEIVDRFPNIEAVSVSVISVKQRPKAPLPGRQKKSASVNREADPQPSTQHIVQEERLPAIPRKTPPTHIAPTETKFQFSPVKNGSVKSIPTTPNKDDRQPQSPIVKKEYISPTPPSLIKPQRRLVRESVNFYPIPESCVRTHPQYRENRRAFFQEHNKALIKLGLKKTKAFFRDDGLVIEWTSQVPVWSDTLEPEIPNLASAMQEFIAKSPQRTPKRRREGSLANNLSGKREPIEGPDPPLSTPSKRRKRETTPQKHWAAGFSMDEIDRMAICISPSPPPKPSLPPKPRQPLPTRLHRYALNSNSNSMIKPEATQSAPVLKYDERVTSVRDKEAHPSRLSPEPAPKRMIFKPTNPRRKVQTETAPVACVTPSGAEGSGGSMQTVDAQATPSDTALQGERGLGDNTASPFQPSQLSFRSPSTELPTAVRLSPTTVDESAWPKPSRPQVVGPIDDNVRPMGDDASSWNVCATIESAEEVAKDLLENYSDDGSSDVINSADEEDIESNLALEFFSRFITLFDSDRSKLEMAYAKDALFSCRVHHLQENDFSMAGQFAPELKPSFLSSHCRATASAVEQGRSRICDRLRSLGPHKFRAQPGSVVWDMAPLPVGAQGHLMFSVHGEVVHPSQAGPHLDHVLTVDQTFVLRPRTAEDEGDDNEITGLSETDSDDIWPLVAISHQMTVREARLLSAETLGNLLPWAQSIQSRNENFEVEDTLRLG